MAFPLLPNAERRFRAWVPEEMGLMRIYGSAAVADVIRHQPIMLLLNAGMSLAARFWKREMNHIGKNCRCAGTRERS
jgi:hypothetical protein